MALVRRFPLLVFTGALSLSGCAAGETPETREGGAPGVGGAGGGGAHEGGSGGAGGAGGSAPRPRTCKVPAGRLDAAPSCEDDVPPVDGLELVEKWRYVPVPWSGADAVGVVGLPLVASLSDDDGDGAIDLCDVPDVLVLESHYDLSESDAAEELVLVVVSGDDGHVVSTIAPGKLSRTVPAIADLDGDGVPEILATNRDGHVVAFTAAGAPVWESTSEVFDPIGWYQLDPPEERYLRAIYVATSAIAVHDLDGDGSPEILFGMTVLDANGDLRFADPTQGAEFGDITAGRGSVRPTVADLDGDGVLEVLMGHVTYDESGEERWRVPGITPGNAHPADFLGDGTTQVLITSDEGLTLVSASGEVLWGPTRLGHDNPPLEWCWGHAAAVADLDHDGRPEAIVNSCEERLVLRIDEGGPTVLRSEPVPITTSFGAPTSGSTAFDFRGQGPDWIAYHHEELAVFAGIEPPPVSIVSKSFMVDGLEYPVVADVDNDGSADVLLRSAYGTSLVAYEDAAHRPSPARRIWNQWAYAPGFVREDATIPANVTGASSYRAQRRIECEPAPR